MAEPRLKRTGKVLFITAFMIFWIVGLVTGLTASSCRKLSYHGEKKLRICNISLSVGSILPREASKRSIIYVERGIALSELGREQEAIADFRRALDDVADVRESYLQRIIQRLDEEPEGSKAKVNFATAMATRQ